MSLIPAQVRRFCPPTAAGRKLPPPRPGTRFMSVLECEGEVSGVDPWRRRGITVTSIRWQFASRSTELTVVSTGAVQPENRLTVVHKGYFHGFSRDSRRPQAMEIFLF